MRTLTAQQQKLMVFLETEIKHHGIAPSYAEIGAVLGLKSKHSVSNLLDTLQRAGLIKRTRNARSIELLPSEYHHPADCVCGACARARYLRDLQLVHALEVAPPVALIPKLRGLRPFSEIRPDTSADACQFVHADPQKVPAQISGQTR